MSIAVGIAEVRASVKAACLLCGRDPLEVQLVAVSKTKPSGAVREALAEGQKVFGENKVQELLVKSGELEDAGVRWHLIGGLQTNKAKFLPRVPGLELVHSLDREKLADTLERVFADAGRKLDVLLQINATGERQKHGIEPGAAHGLLQHVLDNCPHLQLRGLMGMGPLEGDPRPAFDRVSELRKALERDCDVPLPILSLGMTGDLGEAIAAGSNLIRVGTAIFGQRG